MAGVSADTDPPQTHPAFDRGIDFIRRQAAAKKPFCCFVSSSEPHDPYVPPKRFLDLYDQRKIELSPTLRSASGDDPPVIQRMRGVWKDISDQDWRFITATYYAMISFLDHEAGRLLAAVKDCGVDDNTIVIFTSDHGDMLGGHGLFAKGITPYEEVYNIPLIIRAPGVRGGEDRRHVTSTVDLAPTILDLCGLAPIDGVQGRSLRPVLEGRANDEDWQDAYAEFFGQRFVYTQRITWHGRWKYIFAPGGWDELYDLAADPHEQHNLAGEAAHRETLEDMARRMWRRMRDIGDESLFGSNYATLRLAPVGPQSAQ
jgi:choline-sulfatase